MDTLALGLLGLAPIQTRGQRAHGALSVDYEEEHEYSAPGVGEERRKAIVVSLKCEGPMTRFELAQLYGVAEDTMKRDLEELIEEGQVQKRLHKNEAIYWVKSFNF